MNYLEVVDGQGRRRQVVLDRSRILIGREPSCDVHLPHPAVSRRHAQLQLTEQGLWLLQDLSSRNHVYVDNRPVQQVVLPLRKLFRIAEYWLTLQEKLPESTTAEPVTPPLDDTADTATALEGGWLEQMLQFQRTLFQISEAPQVLERLGREFQRLLHPEVLAIGHAHQQGYVWERVEGDNQEPAVKAKLVEAERKVAEDHSSFQSWSPGELNQDESVPPLSAMCLLFPMKGRQGIVGHVYVVGPQPGKVPKVLRNYLSLAANNAGLAWDNLQLASLQQAHLEFVKELEHARQIQIGLFPETFDIDPRLDIFAVNLPSAQVSGDYYDVLRTGPNTVAFVIADAMGHGMPAALLMAAVRAALRMGLKLGLSWSAIFKGLDDLIHAARGDTFVTGMVGQLDLAAHELQLVVAGHPLPSILVDGQPLAIPDQCLTRPWGLDLESVWEVGRLPLAGNHWSLVSYTDGITDAASRSQRATGAQRVAAFHKKNSLRSAEDLCQGLLSEVAVQPGNVTLADDQTVLVLRSPLAGLPVGAIR